MTTRADIYCHRLETIYPFESPDVVVAAEAVVTILSSSGHSVDPCSLYDEVIRSVDVGRRVRQRRRPTFNLTFPAAAAHLGRVGNFNHAFLDLDLRDNVDWDNAVAVCAGLGPMLCTRLVDSQYDYWQNAYDPLQFSAAGRSMEGLPMKSNELPPPLDQMVVDTSRNPGRRILRHGYVEAIGHRMWLGPEFFRRVPSVSREAVLSNHCVKVTERSDGILELVAQDEPFVDDSTADLQNCLRRLLFPTTAENG